LPLRRTVRTVRSIRREVNMRTVLAAAFSLATTGLALAADLPVANYYTVPEPLGPSSWAGPYLGASFGYEHGEVSNNPTNPAGVFGGIEAGYNWQRGQFVWGGETDIQLSGADDTFAAWQFSNPWFGTLRGRVGVALGDILLFGTAGLAYGALRAETAGITETATGLGWVAGGGLEVGLTPHWSAKAEWLYLDLSDHSFGLTAANNGLAANLLRLGFNYRF
jgi:outer membrane immunogenic protein